MKTSYHFDADNRRAARIILADPEKHAGLALAWAKLWRERHPDVCLEIKSEPAAKHSFAA
jgi:hypothetical protein